MTTTLISAFEAHVARQPDKIFWRDGSGGTGQEWSFAQMRAAAGGFAAAYHTAGLQLAAPLLLFLPHGGGAMAAFIGALLAGGTPCFMACPTTRQHAPVFWASHADVLARLGKPLIVTTSTFAAQMRQAGLAELASGILVADAVAPGAGVVQPADPAVGTAALLVASSGTIARKKFVGMTHAAILAHTAAYAERLAMTGSDNVVNWLPLHHHIGLLAGAVLPMILGQTVTGIPAGDWVARPALLFDALHQHHGHFTWMPNFAFELLEQVVPRDYAGELSHVKAFVNCGEACRPATLHRFAQRFEPLGVRPEQLQLCYTVAESVFAVSQTRPAGTRHTLRLESVKLHRFNQAVDAPKGERAVELFGMGEPLAGADMRISDEDGNPVAEDIVGEITLAGPFVTHEYINDPRTTFERFAHGRFRTGDFGFMRGGELYVLGRKDDQINVNGWRLFGQEVERIINELPGMKPFRSAAFGVFNRKTGSEDLIVVAEYEGPGGADSAGGRQLSRAVRAAVYDQTGIEVSVMHVAEPDWLIRHAGGGITRRASRTKYIKTVAAAVLPAGAAPQGSVTFTELADVIAGHFLCRAADITPATVVGDIAGWNSLSHTTLMLELEAAFDVRFDDTEMFSFVSVADLVRRISILQAKKAPGRPDRNVYRSNGVSIVRLGEANTGAADIVVFAGLAMKMDGGPDVVDFASILAETDLRDSTKYFVTDRRQRFFVDQQKDVAAALDAASPQPKILIGNSTGGYGALLFAQHLPQVQGVLVFGPHPQPPDAIRDEAAHPAVPPVRFHPGVHYCILFGEAGDADDLQQLQAAIDDPSRQHIVIVRNCGHNLLGYLNAEKLLAPVLGCAARPATMAADIAAIVAQLPPKPELRLEPSAPKTA